MEKHARKRATDPVQEQLRENKSRWNKACSNFIAQLIAWKKAFNGRGDTRMGLPPSRIQDPLAPEVVTFLSSLDGNFDKLIQSAHALMKEQEAYSNTRQQRIQQRKQVVSSFKPTLEKDGSNKLTRLFSYLSSVFSGDEYKHYRLGMLRSAAALDKSLHVFRSKILERSLDSIPDAMDMYMKIIYNFTALKEHFNRLLSFAKTPEGEAPVAPEPEDEGVERPAEPAVKEKKTFVRTTAVNLRDLKKDLASIVDVGMPASVLEGIENKLNAYDKETNPTKKELLDDLIWEEYEKILHNAKKFVEKQLNKVIPEDFGSLEELAEEYLAQLVFKKSNVTYEIVKQAGFLQWMKENVYKLTPFEMTSASKLEISENIKKTRKDLNKLMSILETRVDVEEIKELFSIIKEDLDEIKEPLKILITIHKDFYLSKNHGKDKKMKKDLLDMELERKIKRDIHHELFYGR